MRYKIGELARRADCRAATVRYYEREGLLPPPARSGGNYRLYGEEELERLRFIRHCRRHGLSLPEIRRLLAFTDSPCGSCDWIGALIRSRISDVEKRIEDLRHLKSDLESLLEKCAGDAKGGCGILENLKKRDDCPCCSERLRREAEAGGNF